MSDRNPRATWVAGRVGRAHGVKGEVVVDVLTSVPEQRFLPGARLVEVDGRRQLTVRAVRPHQGRLLVAFEDVLDRTGAEELRGMLLAGVGDPGPPDGEMWAADLEGFAVVSKDGGPVGLVAEVMANPAHDLLVVRRSGAADALVPLVAAFVVDIDVDGRRIVLDPPEGLL